MISGRVEFISANSFDFFYIVRNLLVQITNFLRVYAELISANLIQIHALINSLIPYFILAVFLP